MTAEEVLEPKGESSSYNIGPLETFGLGANYWHLTPEEVWCLSYGEIEAYAYIAARAEYKRTINAAILTAVAFHKPEDLNDLQNNL